MAAEAEAAREARAKVIAAEGEMKSSRALKEASEIISASPSALQVSRRFYYIRFCPPIMHVCTYYFIILGLIDCLPLLRIRNVNILFKKFHVPCVKENGLRMQVVFFEANTVFLTLTATQHFYTLATCCYRV